MTTWHLFLCEPGAADWNMAADDYLLELAEKKRNPILRIYGWLPAALSIGYAQPIARHVDLLACRSAGVPLIRRMTGGKAVFHQHELTYSISGSREVYPFNLSLLESYHEIAKALLAGLKILGVQAQMADKDFQASGQQQSSCFAQPSSYEIVLASQQYGSPVKKIIGSAQKRTKSAVLQHGSLLIRYEPLMWKKLLRNMEDRVLDRATSLCDVLGENFSQSDVRGAFIDGFKMALDIKFTELELGREAMEGIQERLPRYPDLTLNLDSSSDSG